MPTGTAFGGVIEFEMVLVKAEYDADGLAGPRSLGTVTALSGLMLLNALSNAQT